MSDLDAELRAATARVADLEAELAGIVSTAAASPPDDEHDVEGSSVGFERARVAALLDHARRHLGDLNRAVRARAAGHYGSCAGCGRPIGAERLSALPATRYCVGCAGSAGSR
ncbi:MAG TPA: TraR/DksA C4-type zinc finger protein [Acidimicrobiales bacterium]|nr:TraR/DksA C4-type zinc finger protein [Acidimicrobiales bacterium]